MGMILYMGVGLLALLGVIIGAVVLFGENKDQS